MTDEVEISGLTNLELRELERILGEQNIRKLPAGREGNAHREPGLVVASVILGSAIIAATTIILSKNKETSGRDITIKRTKNSEEEILEVQLSEIYEKSSAPDQETIEKIADVFKVDMSALASVPGEHENNE